MDSVVVRMPQLMLTALECHQLACKDCTDDLWAQLSLASATLHGDSDTRPAMIQKDSVLIIKL